DAPRIDAELVVPVNVVVDERGQEIVRGADRVEVAGEMQIDVGHRDDLRTPAAGGTAFHAEARSEARLPEADRGVLAEVIQRIAEPDGRGRLPLSRRRGGDGRHENQLAVRASFEIGEGAVIDLRLVVPVRDEKVRGEAE